MKTITKFSRTAYLILLALVGAYFVEQQRYGLAFIQLVIIMLFINKHEQEQQ